MADDNNPPGRRRYGRRTEWRKWEDPHRLYRQCAELAAEWVRSHGGSEAAAVWVEGMMKDKEQEPLGEQPAVTLSNDGNDLLLTKRQTRMLGAIAEGKTPEQAALAAGYSAQRAKKAEELIVPIIRRRFRKLLYKRVKLEKIADRLAEGLDATEIKHFAFQGEVKDERELVDFAERRKYIETAAALMGLEEEKQQGGGNQTTIVLAPWMGRKGE